jgi:helix-turn-helix protein
MDMTAQQLQDALLPEGAVAERLSASPRFVRKLRLAGRLESVKLDGLRRYRQSDVNQFIAGLGDESAAHGRDPVAGCP